MRTTLTARARAGNPGLPAFLIHLIPYLAQAAVVALADNIQALQKQLEQSELDCVNQKAQIAMLTRLTGPAVAAPVMPPVDRDAAMAVQPGSLDAPATNGNASTEVRLSSETSSRPRKLHCRRHSAQTHGTLALICSALPGRPPPHRAALHSSSGRLCWLMRAPGSNDGALELSAHGTLRISVPPSGRSLPL